MFSKFKIDVNSVEPAVTVKGKKRTYFSFNT